MLKKIKLVFSSVREYKKYAILTPIFMIGEALMECLIPWEMTNLIQAMKVPGSTIASYASHIYILIAMALVSIICGMAGGYTAAIASTGLAKNLRMDVYKKLQSFSFANIDKFSASSLVTRMTTDITNTQQSFQMCIRIVIRAPLMLIFSTVMGFITGGNMAWIFIGIIPIITIGLILIARKVMPIFRRVFKDYDNLNQSVQENISGIRVVKSYVREEYEQQKFNSHSERLCGEFIKAEKRLAFANPLLNTAVHLSNILVLAIGSNIICGLAASGATDMWLSPEKLSALITYGIQILMSLMMISMILVFLVMSLESIKRISEVLEEESTIVNPENPIYEVKDGSVKFENVFFKYSEASEKDTLSDINLDIKSGDFVGILGTTGSGKTSLVNLISRLYDISSGSLKVGDIEVNQYDLKTLRDNVAVVLQKNLLFSGTIEDNLRWGNLNATQEEIVEACKIAQAEEFIESFPDKYQTHIEQGGNNVSGGQKQRLCIARAILKKPKILILDDSTSAVDTKTDKLIRKGLKEIIPDTTKIVIAQRISSIEDADKIIILDNGKIDAIGTHKELLKNNKIYKEIYDSQTKKGGK